MEKTTVLSRIVPGSLIGRTLLFLFFPLALLIMTAWAALLHPIALSPYLLASLLMGVSTIALYRAKGFAFSILLLSVAFFFKHTDLAFWEIGLTLAVAFDLLVILLAFDEMRRDLADAVEESKSRTTQYLAKNQELLECEESWSKTKERLEEELARWKEEAEQRKLDIVDAQKRLDLVETEINLLTEQKESILQEAYSIRGEATERLKLLSQQMEEVERAREEVHRQLDALPKQDLEQKELEIQELKEQLHKQQSSSTPSAEMHRLEGLYAQLRQQFEEKSRVLVQTRKELFKLQTEVALKAKEEELEALSGNREEALSIEMGLSEVVEECARLEAEVKALEELISHVLNQ